MSGLFERGDPLSILFLTSFSRSTPPEDLGISVESTYIFFSNKWNENTTFVPFQTLFIHPLQLKGIDFKSHKWITNFKVRVNF